ncbi:MAG: ABC transporter ATP-binding protein/permease [Butyrivibrio sp.]|nr:ABC transporter ATP-binding protein/permease [Acetatifactor muris]MCM1559301.1 ABC transporter ATP-binding protein/permease [Butyrivibrio sp.]
MGLILHYMKGHWKRIVSSVSLKTLAALGELMIPYILEHIIDDVVPTKDVLMVFAWGLAMIAAAFLVRTLNIQANHRACATGRDCIRSLRHDLFQKTINLSGAQFDRFGLPSLTSRMTSDSYNVQNFIVSMQAMGIRAPVMLLGGIVVTMTMDPALSGILCIMVPVLGVIIYTVTRHGIPLYDKVQRGVDGIVRVMRENITGIRVVKALSKEEYEKKRFDAANRDMTNADIKAGVTMAMPGPIMQLFLNIGLTLVVIVGARRVNSGVTKPGVILAFLTYFNMILQGVMGLNRIFMMMSKATASADRIRLILEAEDDQPVLPFREEERLATDAHIMFDHISFAYHENAGNQPSEEFAGGVQEKCLSDIHFSIGRGESLGVIGATGSGKTTILNLLMRFYDCNEGGVYIDGRDVRTYEKDDLRRKFGIALQNDTIFNDTLRENITFGRNVPETEMIHAAEIARLADFIEGLEGKYDYMADIKGANLSGGQKQRTLIARAVADKPEILILDDSSSALDYRTDAALRKSIQQDLGDSTLIMVAQRVSSIMNLTNILVLDEGKIIGYGNHEYLLQSCPVYRDIFEAQTSA